MYWVDLNMSQTAVPQKLVHLIDVIRPGGGPYGYLYNLHKAAEQYGDNNYVVRYDTRSLDRVNSSSMKFRWPNFIARHLKPLKFMAQLLFGQRLQCENEAHKEHAVVMVHLAPHAARILRIKNKSAKLVFMPHAPTSFTDEVMGEITLRHGRSMLTLVYRWMLEKLELRIMSSADLMVVAAIEGVESYFDGRGIPAREVLEVTSGVPGFVASTDRETARQQLALPANKVIVGYFGRYNQDKGFDFLLEEMSSMVSFDSVLFISAGVGVLAPIDLPNYVNFGWRSDVDVLISACDVVVTPNKHTYFDLLPLEALSLSKPVFASRVGGNKRLAKLTGAVILFDRQPGALVDGLKSFVTMSPQQRQDMGRCARESYENHFSLNAFRYAHCDLAERVLNRFDNPIEIES